MIPYILAPILISSIFFFSSYEYKRFTFFIFIITSLISCMTGICVDSNYMEKHGELVEVESYDLKTIIDNSSLHGDFTLGNGVVRGQTMFIYYTKEDDGSYMMRTVRTDKARVIFTQGEAPVLKIYDLVADPTWYAAGIDEEHFRYEFHIPEGSIDNIHHLDIQ